MHTSALLKHFPPPRFLVMDNAGLEISDDFIRCIEFRETISGMRIHKYASVEIPAGIIKGGDIKDEEAFKQLLSAFVKENNLSYVKVSIPEEKAYMFQTEVPSTDPRIATQNIEFKLEENVPLATPDAIFYFDFIPREFNNGLLKASVSVVSRSYIEKYNKILEECDLSPIAFEIVPTAVARAVGSTKENITELIVHGMKSKTGIYIVSGGAVTFTSTITHEVNPTGQEYAALLTKEIVRINSYWASRNGSHPSIQKIILTGCKVADYKEILLSEMPSVELGQVWANILDLRHYTPSIPQEKSLDYVVAAGLGMDS